MPESFDVFLDIKMNLKGKDISRDINEKNSIIFNIFVR